MYALITNEVVEKYPYSIDQLRKDNPQVSFPAVITQDIHAEYGVYPVRPLDRPEVDPVTHEVRETTPALVGGAWVQQWEINPLPAEEVAANRAAAAQSLQQAIVDATQQRLDSFARTRNYDGILSACTYATSNIPKFATEGQTAVNLRDATWAALYQILEEVQAGQRETPTGFSDIEHLLPPLEWPV